ncbi:hypothetical protein ACHAXT_001752 [Thalassiosira profunda]
MPSLASHATNFALAHPPREATQHRALLASHATNNAYDVSVPIIYENERLLAVAKPPRIPHHDDASSPGILSVIRHQQQQPNPSFSYPGRLYGVHRLDKVTSGILLFAKDSATASELMCKFNNKEIQKYYVAISGKKPKKGKQGWVKGEMVLGRRGSYKLVNSSRKPKIAEDDSGEGMDDDDRTAKRSIGYAVTRFFTAGLGNLQMVPQLLDPTEGSEGRAIPKTAILFQPHTGRTHQLRVAAKSVGLPILGDARYGGGRLETSTADGTDWDRTYLHACAMHFQLSPFGRRRRHDVTIWSPPPFDHLFAPGELNGVFVGMMEKHCDCAPILDALHHAR